MIMNLESATRLKSSVYGNPRWSLTFEEGTYVTSSDCSVNYIVTNLLPTEGSSTPVKVTLTRSGRVSGMVRPANV